MEDLLTFSRIDLQQTADRQLFVDLGQEYFQWMDGEIRQMCGFSIPSIVNMALGDYVIFTTEIAASINPNEGGIYFLRDSGGKVAAMGGLRCLPSGGAEIVRIYTRPEYRGAGHGSTMVEKLISEARQLGYLEIFLDTGVFMTSAQKIYSAAGFSFCDPYPGAEPPDALKPYWLYMKRTL